MNWKTALLCTFLMPSLSSSFAQSALSANDRMLVTGPQMKKLKTMEGSWDVIMTFQPVPEAIPVIVKGIRAKRVMLGSYLQETMTADSLSSLPPFSRVAYTVYNIADNRWENVTIDTRIASIMNRDNYGNEQGDSITFFISNFTLAGFGQTFEGKSVRLRDLFIRHDNNSDELQQYWTPAGGKEWLAVRYVYTRRLE